MKTMKCKELGIEFTLKQEQKGVKFKDIKIPKGWNLFGISLMAQLWDIRKYREALQRENEGKLWVFVKNFDYLKNEFIMMFYADSNWADFDGSRGMLGSIPTLGVIFWRKLK